MLLKNILKVFQKIKPYGEISIQYMDYEKLNSYLGWKPKYSFKKTLPILFKWYGLYFKKKKKMTIAIDMIGTALGSGTKTYNINFCKYLIKLIKIKKYSYF